jgi:hypothetical protein
MQRLTQVIDGQQNFVPLGFNQSDTIYEILLAATVPQYIAPPAGCSCVLIGFNGTQEIWMQLGVSSGLAVPAANNLTGTGNTPECLPPGAGPYLRQLRGATSIGLISTPGCVVSLSFFL